MNQLRQVRFAFVFALLSSVALAQSSLDAPAKKPVATLRTEIKRGCNEMLNAEFRADAEEAYRDGLTLIQGNENLGNATDGYMIGAHLGLWLKLDISWESSPAESIRKLGYSGTALSAWDSLSKDLKANPLAFDQLCSACGLNCDEFMKRVERWKQYVSSRANAPQGQ